MDLSLTETEQLLGQSVRDFVTRSAGKDRLVDLHAQRAPSPSDWLGAMASAGWLGLLIPVDCGGSAASPMEAAMLFHELGRGPVPPAWLLTAGVCAPLLSAAPDSALRTQALREMASGESVVVPAFQVAGTRWAGVRPIACDGSLTAELTFACGVEDSTHIAVPVSCRGEESYALVPTTHSGVQSRPLTGFLAASYAVSITDLDLDEIRLVPTALSSERHEHGLALAAAMVSAYQVGSCERLLEVAVAHANERVQFGQLIGAFQRVQDHVVRIVNGLDSARWVLYDALASTDDATAFISKAWLARAAAIDAHWEAANAAHEVLAGIGSDPAHGTVLHTAMSRLLHDLLGDPSYCRRRHGEAEGWFTSLD